MEDPDSMAVREFVEGIGMYFGCVATSWSDYLKVVLVVLSLSMRRWNNVCKIGWVTAGKSSHALKRISFGPAGGMK